MADWDPTVAEVASLIRARTKPRDGQDYLGTFNEDTAPTGTQVDALIEQAVGDVESKAGTIPEDQEARAGNVAALYAAMLVELSFFPEQIQNDQSPYDRLKELYDSALAGLLSAVQDNSPRRGLYSIPITTPEVSA